MQNIIITKIIFIILLLNFTTAKSQDKAASFQIGALKSWDGRAHPVGVSCTYYSSLDSNFAITGSVGYFMYSAEKGTFIGGEYGHSVIPVSVGVLYFLNNQNSGMYTGIETGIILHTNNDSRTSYMRWGIFEKANNQSKYFSFSPVVGYIWEMNKKVNFDLNLKYLIVSSGSCLVLNAGIKVPI